MRTGPATGELVLLLHGFPETSYEWREQLPTLAAAGYRAVAPDQRGYASGTRPTNVDTYKIDELASDALGFADTLGVDRFHLVGHDWGGAVAWHVAGGRSADRLRTLTVVSTPHPTALANSIADGEQREKSSYMLMFRDPSAEALFLDNDAAMFRGLYEGGGVPSDAAHEYLRVLLEPGALTGGLNWYRANDFRADIGAITVPTMYVWSTDDVALGREAAEATAAFVDGPYRFEVIDGVSHWLPEEAADQLNTLLLSHLSRV